MQIKHNDKYIQMSLSHKQKKTLLHKLQNGLVTGAELNWILTDDEIEEVSIAYAKRGGNKNDTKKHLHDCRNKQLKTLAEQVKQNPRPDVNFAAYSLSGQSQAIPVVYSYHVLTQINETRIRQDRKPQRLLSQEELAVLRNNAIHQERTGSDI